MKKMNYLLAMFFVSMLFFGLVGCSKDDDDSYRMNNQDFVTKASSSNMLEIASGQLAVNKGQDAAVKAYGEHMVNDHGKTAMEMSALASKKNWTIPTTMLPEHQEILNNLQNISGPAFDKQFAAVMVDSHQKTIALFEDASSNNGVPDGELRSFASGKLPALKAHLQEAQQLQAGVND